MRMMFSSARLENVEQVKTLFDAAGIECRIIGGRSYKTYSRRGFSYNEKQALLDEPQPQLWVSRADDYRAAREILKQHGLLESKAAEPSYLPKSHRQAPQRAARPAERLNKVRMLLLAVVIGLILIQGIRLMAA